MTTHFSVLSAGQKPQSLKCKDQSTLLCCPFCPHYKGDYAKVETHIQSHLKSVIRHGGYVMYACKWGCTKDSHYHCCGCGTIFTIKKKIMKHLNTCHPQLLPLQHQQPRSLSGHLQPLPQSQLQQPQPQSIHLHLLPLSQSQHHRPQPQSLQLKSQPHSQSLQLKPQSQAQSLQFKPQSQSQSQSLHLKPQPQSQSLQLQHQPQPQSLQLKSQPQSQSLQLQHQPQSQSLQLQHQHQPQSQSLQLQHQPQSQSLQLQHQPQSQSLQLKSQPQSQSLQLKSQPQSQSLHLKPQPQSLQLQHQPQSQSLQLQPHPESLQPQSESLHLQPHQQQPHLKSQPDGSSSHVKQAHCSVLSRGQKPKLLKCEDPECTLLHCPFCPHYKGDYARVETHIQSHLKSVIRHGEYVMYACNRDCRKGRHYHCCGCSIISTMKKSIMKHLSTCHPQPLQPQPKSLPQDLQSQPGPQLGPKPRRAASSSRVRRVQCTSCHIILNMKNLTQHKRHRHSVIIEDIRADRFLACECLDSDLGIYAVLKSFKDKSAPIHVQKKTSGMDHQIRCTLGDCLRFKEKMHKSGFVAFDCVHIQSLKYCPSFLTSKIQLKETVLNEIVSNKWFSEERKRACLLKQAAACEEGIPFSVEVKVGSSSTMKFVSVYEPHLSYCNPFGRLMVRFDAHKNTWHCLCVRPNHSCIHKCIAKWHFFQTRKEYFISNVNNYIEERDVDEEDTKTQCKNSCEYPPQNEDLKRIVRYIHAKKKLPAHLPAYFCGLTSENDLPTHLIPKEQICPACPGNIPLGKPFVITESARIITVKGIIEGVTTFCKKCSTCGMMIRYQEWEDGVHNFNDKIILTLHFCIYLRNCIQTHTTLSQAIETWELTSGQPYPSKKTLIHAYLHFEVLSDHNYDSSCDSCGHPPSVGIMQLHKSCDSLGVGDLENPPLEFDGNVITDDFWNSVCLESIAQGFIPSDGENPFTDEERKKDWAHWFETHSQKSILVLNTEHANVQTDSHHTGMDATEDRLLEEVSNFKVHPIHKLCKDSRIVSKCSKMGLILRLRKELAMASKYDRSQATSPNFFSEDAWDHSCKGFDCVEVDADVIY